jgi:signal transduction histidine kinase
MLKNQKVKDDLERSTAVSRFNITSKLSRLKQYQLSLIGVFVCFVFGGFYVLDVLYSYSEYDNVLNPVGALAQWLASFYTKAPSLVRVGSDRAILTYNIILATRIIVPVIVALCFLLLMHGKQRRHSWFVNSLLVLQIACSAAEVSPLLYLLPLQFPLLLPTRKAWKFLLLQTLLVFLTFVYALLANPALTMMNLQKAMIGFSELLIFYLLIFIATLTFVRERTSRLKLGAANAELQAMQILLHDTVSASERIRIARDLHDAIGHHLTALNLHLDLATRQTDASISSGLQTAITTSRELASSLLAEVRAVVSAERDAQQINLHQALSALCEGIPKPVIELRFDPATEISSALLAHTLFRCIQEAISNTVKHAAATHLFIHLERNQKSIDLRIEDNGKACMQLHEGNGLRGMRERVEQLGGELQFSAMVGQGFSLTIRLPLDSAGMPAIGVRA